MLSEQQNTRVVVSEHANTRAVAANTRAVAVPANTRAVAVPANTRAVAECQTSRKPSCFFFYRRLYTVTQG